MSSAAHDDDDDDEYVVTNLDDGEKYSADQVSKKFSVLQLAGDKLVSDTSSSRPTFSQNSDGKRQDDRKYDDHYDSKSSNSLRTCSDAGIDHSNISYNPVNVPDGGRLNFFRITAVGTTKDAEERSYSVFYLDVRCNVASPNSWFVYRRYSQFRKLSDILRSEGYYVPVLPPKRLLGTLGSVSVDFVKQRKSDLESWLYNLVEMHASHPGAKDPQTNPHYRRFLTEDANKPPSPLTRIYPEHIRSAPGKDEISDSAQAKTSAKVHSADVFNSFQYS